MASIFQARGIDSINSYVEDNWSDVLRQTQKPFSKKAFFWKWKGCKVKIGDETEYVTYAVGYVDIDDLLEYNIYSIVQGGSKDAYHNETDKCR